MKGKKWKEKKERKVKLKGNEGKEKGGRKKTEKGRRKLKKNQWNAHNILLRATAVDLGCKLCCHIILSIPWNFFSPAHTMNANPCWNSPFMAEKANQVRMLSHYRWVMSHTFLSTLTTTELLSKSNYSPLALVLSGHDS